MGMQAQQPQLHPLAEALNQLLMGGQQQGGDGKSSTPDMKGGDSSAKPTGGTQAPTVAASAPPVQFPFNQAHWGSTQGQHGPEGPLGAGSSSVMPKTGM